MTQQTNRGGAPLGNQNRKLHDTNLVYLAATIRQDQLDWLNKQPENRSELTRQAIDLLMNIKGDISHT